MMNNEKTIQLVEESNKKHSELSKIKREQNKILTTHFFSFVFVFLLLGVFVISVVNFFSFKDISNELLELKDSINSNINEVTTQNGTKIVEVGARDNARISMILYGDINVDGSYNVHAFDDNILTYLINDYYYYQNEAEGGMFQNPEEYREFVEQSGVLESVLFRYNIESGLHMEKITLANDYYFHTLSFTVDNVNAPNIKFCKLLVMVNGEMNSRNQVIRIFSFTAFLMFIFAFFASVILSKLSIRPVKQALDKQLTFVSDASHELRTPLAIVQNKLENILTKSNKTVYEVSSDIAVSLNEITRLSKLTNDLLTLANSDDEKLKLIYEVFNLYDLVFETVIPFQEMAEIEAKSFKLVGESVNINADKSKISQLLIILLDNALKYTVSGDEVTVNIITVNSDICISIADTGIGIDDPTKLKIFERFYRADKARSRESGGNGLGLAIARTITNAHKGSIKVIDNNPKGSKFVINLPKNIKVEKK